MPGFFGNKKKRQEPPVPPRRRGRRRQRSGQRDVATEVAPPPGDSNLLPRPARKLINMTDPHGARDTQAVGAFAFDIVKALVGMFALPPRRPPDDSSADSVRPGRRRLRSDRDSPA